MAEGVFAAFRNPAAHEPRLVWEVSEQDALDVVGTLSMIHRPSAPTNVFAGQPLGARSSLDEYRRWVLSCIPSR
jgi:hypothetical protein